MKYELKIEGMGCAHCIAVVQNLLASVGAQNVRVELGRAEFLLANADSLQQVIQKIDEQGYQVVDVLS